MKRSLPVTQCHLVTSSTSERADWMTASRRGSERHRLLAESGSCGRDRLGLRLSAPAGSLLLAIKRGLAADRNHGKQSLQGPATLVEGHCSILIISKAHRSPLSRKRRLLTWSSFWILPPLSSIAAGLVRAPLCKQRSNLDQQLRVFLPSTKNEARQAR